ncbi:MAG: DUF4153 domain-containing protein [Flavobacteriales bacterium]|nr:DUF4153 domain-containing protein [Flavobacteriales bacterium]
MKSDLVGSDVRNQKISIMKLVSINYLVNRSKESLLRFPLTILSALLGVAMAIYLIEYGKDTPNLFPYINFLLTSALGIPLFFCAAVVAQKRDSRTLGLIGAAVSIVILLLIYFSLPTADETHNTYIPYIRYGVFNVIIHLLVSFAPFLGSKELVGFWNYNKGLFIRVFIAGIYSGVLYTGLVMALTALHVLFDIEIHEELYFEIWIVITGLFNTWFFVAGLPTDLNELENVHEYPKGLKIFAQYILLPLLVLYLVILYAYGSKILLQWDWPKGIVSYMITAVSVLGILNVLLIHPYGSLSGNEWIKKFSKVYYYLLFPLIALLFMAIWFRVGDYGITINRYAIIALGVWLTIVASYFSFIKGTIKFVPVSLAVILTLSSFGPWGMFSVSEKSQAKRLEDILTESGILKDGKVVNEAIWKVDSVLDGNGIKRRNRNYKGLTNLHSENRFKNEDVLADSLHNEVKSILDYLDDHHGFATIRPWFSQDIDSLLVAADADNESELYMESLGLKHQHRNTNENPQYYEYRATFSEVAVVSGYDFLVKSQNIYEGRSGNDQAFELDGITFRYELEDNELVLYSGSDTIDFNFSGFVAELRQEYGKASASNINPNTMRIGRQMKKYDVVLQLISVNLQEVDKLKVDNISCEWYFRLRDQ